MHLFLIPTLSLELCVVGIILVVIFKPGVDYVEDEEPGEEDFSTVDALLDVKVGHHFRLDFLFSRKVFQVFCHS